MNGCLLSTTSAVFPSNTDYDIPWTSQLQFGSESFWTVGSPTLIKIPAALNGSYVEFFGCHVTSTSGTSTVDANTEIIHNTVGLFTGFQQDNNRWIPGAMRSGLYSVATDDEFRMQYRTFGTTGAANLPFTKFGCLVNPHETLMGLTSAKQGVGQAVGSGVVLNWAAPDVDTLDTFNATTGFIAPSDSKAAVVTLYGDSAAFDNSSTNWEVRKNATAIRAAYYDTQGRAGWGGTWLVDVEPDDVLTGFLHRSGTTEPDRTRIQIEWHG